MADLDDFFARKDKKKNKSKKFLSSEELVKQLEQSLKEKEANKVKPAKVDEESSTVTNQQDHEDEWKEFEETKRPDLSNLKLGQLTIDENNENNQNSGGNDYETEHSQLDGDNSENPWKQASSAGSAPAPKPEAVQQSKPTGAYVAPGARQELLKASRNKKNAPDLQNEENFPTLGIEKAPTPSLPKKDGFEEVKHGGKQQQTSAGTAPVSVGNAYSSLLSDSLDS